MSWVVEFHPGFMKEFFSLPVTEQDAILAKVLVLEHFGPSLGRPHVDVLKGSRHSKMKELRIDIRSSAWRVALAFDPERKAILLVAGSKTGKNQKQFYSRLIALADVRFDQHLRTRNQKQ